MPVDGYRGAGTVNSYNGGDDAVGTLTSQPFTVERKFIRIPDWWRRVEGKTCINLLREGKVVRHRHGPNTQSGA